MNTCQIQQTTKTLKFVPTNNSSLKVVNQNYCKNFLYKKHDAASATFVRR